MKFSESLGIIIIGCFIAVENFLVILAAIRNKSLRENTHYNLVISLSVSDFLSGLNLILYGSFLASRNDSDQTVMNIICSVYYCVSYAIYVISLQQTFSISLNRYLVITENKLSQTLWNGNRKYLAFCVMVVISLIIFVPIFSISEAGCSFQNVISTNSTPPTVIVVLGSIQTVFILMTFVFYFLTLWNIFKMHHKTDIEVREQTDESKQRNVRKRKRMLNSMKVVSFILLALLVSIIPAVVISFKGLSSSTELVILVLFSSSNSAVNPIIYGINIKELSNEVKTMFRINV